MPDASLAELALQFAPWYIESVSHDDDDIYIYIMHIDVICSGTMLQ